MFAARQRPLLVVEDRLLAMRLSLNTPMLSTAELPSGPARAAIAAYLEGGARRFAVIVRSLRSGTAVTYDLEGEDAQDADGWTVALDSALSFGESMGFVFDDEMLVDRRRETLRRGLAQLHEILAPPRVGGEDDADESVGSATAAAAPMREIGKPGELAEILLEEVDALDHDPQRQGGDAAQSMQEPVARDVPLSKFRSPAAPAPAAPVAEPAPAETTGSRAPAKLGRVRPVRVRVEGDAPPRIDPWLRLLADF
jgi:hypothetical protein